MSAAANPLRAGLAVFLAGLFVVWLIKPIGNPCPDRGALPQGSSTSSAPSLLPPGTRTCTYTTPLGTRARTRYWPWLDWLVLAVIAGAVGYGVRAASGQRRAPRQPSERAPKARTPRERPSRERARQDGAASERDAAERERQRAERERRRRDR